MDEGREGRKRIDGGRKRSERGVWDEEGRKVFRKKMGRIEEGLRGIQEEI